MDLQKRWCSLYKEITEVFGMKYDEITYDFFCEYYSYIKYQYRFNRHYHTLAHIQTMLEGLDDYSMYSNISNDARLKIELGVWFHDLYYDHTLFNGENEKNSANEFLNFANKIGLNFYHAYIIKKAILHTTHINVPDTEISKILCDLDLCGFALDDNDEIGRNIRLEYSNISDEDWKIGRTKFLQDLYNKPNLFYSDYFKLHYSLLAKENILKQISNLNS